MLITIVPPVSLIQLYIALASSLPAEPSRFLQQFWACLLMQRFPPLRYDVFNLRGWWNERCRQGVESWKRSSSELFVRAFFSLLWDGFLLRVSSRIFESNVRNHWTKMWKENLERNFPKWVWIDSKFDNKIILIIIFSINTLVNDWKLIILVRKDFKFNSHSK